MQDIHDGLGSQLVSSLAMAQAGHLSTTQTYDLLRSCIDDLRLAIDTSQDSTSSLSLALGNLRFRMQPRLKAAGIGMHWRTQDLSEPLPLRPEHQLSVLRMVQEIMANTLKHAQAKALYVHVGNTARELVIDIRDDGRGFDPTDAALKARGKSRLKATLRQVSGHVAHLNGTMSTSLLNPINLPPSEVAAILIGFPLLYLINSFTPWSKGLFVKLDRSHRRSFLTSIHALHWTTTLTIGYWLTAGGLSAASVGLHWDTTLIGLATFAILGGVIANRAVDSPALDSPPNDQPLYKRIVDLLAPKTRVERFEHVALCVTAGFCEEFLYRGVGILALRGNGFDDWQAIALTSLSFAGIHGRAAYSAMGIYWVIKGMIYGGLFVWSGSLLLVMALHALWDLALLFRKNKSVAAGQESGHLRVVSDPSPRSESVTAHAYGTGARSTVATHQRTKIVD